MTGKLKDYLKGGGKYEFGSTGIFSKDEIKKYIKQLKEA